jgi:hypothetical protein
MIEAPIRKVDLIGVLVVVVVVVVSYVQLCVSRKEN